MPAKLHFILNNEKISTALPPGMVLLDFIRNHQRLVGTKIGCREGDCGACTVLVGDIRDDRLRYRSMTSCLMPLGNAAGKHIVTVEGLNRKQLTPYQQAIVDQGGSQCGFCTPGFVVSLAGFCLSEEQPSCENAIAAMDGNICRCTGYKSIERAASLLVEALSTRDAQDPVGWLVANGFFTGLFHDHKRALGNAAGYYPARSDSPGSNPPFPRWRDRFICAETGRDGGLEGQPPF